MVDDAIIFYLWPFDMTLKSNVHKVWKLVMNMSFFCFEQTKGLIYYFFFPYDKGWKWIMPLLCVFEKILQKTNFTGVSNDP